MTNERRLDIAWQGVTEAGARMRQMAEGTSVWKKAKEDYSRAWQNYHSVMKSNPTTRVRL